MRARKMYLERQIGMHSPSSLLIGRGQSLVASPGGLSLQSTAQLADAYLGVTDPDAQQDLLNTLVFGTTSPSGRRALKNGIFGGTNGS